MRVLIVENNANLARLWQQHFARAGLDVQTSETCQSAINSIRFSPPDIVVVNLRLKNGDAFSVADFSAYHAPNTRIIFVTRDGVFSDGSAFNYAANACACVPETIVPNDLVAMVEHYGAQVPA